MKSMRRGRRARPEQPHSFTLQLTPHEVDDQHPDPKKVDKENYLRMALVHPFVNYGGNSSHLPRVLDDEHFSFECIETHDGITKFHLLMALDCEDEIATYLHLHRYEIAWQFRGNGLYEAAFHINRLGEEDGKAKYLIVLEEDSPE